jgi:enamine deaminase RidA (YjgF/YER057c/UK114 family)
LRRRIREHPLTDPSPTELSYPEHQLRRLGLTLPSPPPALAHYELGVRAGSLLFLAGHAPLEEGVQRYVGKVGREFTEEEGVEAARLTALNMLATLKAELGDLGRVTRVVKLFAMVNCTETFTRVPDVINGASDLFIEVFGDVGRHARSAVGMQQLHYGMAIEIEGIFEISD